MKQIEKLPIEERRLWVDNVVYWVGYDYSDPESEQDLIEKGLSELIPIAHEVQRIRSELEPLNKKLKELGYYHELCLRPFVDER